MGRLQTRRRRIAAMPGRHTWYSKEFNKLLCEAGSMMGDEAKRNEVYAQAEKILVEDVALVPIYHPIHTPWSSRIVKGPDVRAKRRGPDHLEPLPLHAARVRNLQVDGRCRSNRKTEDSRRTRYLAGAGVVQSLPSCTFVPFSWCLPLLSFLSSTGGFP